MTRAALRSGIALEDDTFGEACAPAPLPVTGFTAPMVSVEVVS